MEVLAHHVKQEVCHTRPKYREGKIPKTVKVYTCAQESKYLIATNIPSIGAHNDLVKLFGLYGEIEEQKMLDEYPCEENCETMLIKFVKIQNARTAKIKMDNYNFLGGCLHVFYAPEFESINDVKEKLAERRAVIETKCAKYDAMKFGTVEYDLMQKKEPYKRTRFVGKGKKSSKSKPEDRNNKKQTINVTSNEATSSNNSDQIMQPQVPPNWIKPSQTGSHSYDESVHEINKRLEATLTHQQEVNLVPRKRRKVVQIDK